MIFTKQTAVYTGYHKIQSLPLEESQKYFQSKSSF